MEIVASNAENGKEAAKHNTAQIALLKETFQQQQDRPIQVESKLHSENTKFWEVPEEVSSPERLHIFLVEWLMPFLQLENDCSLLFGLGLKTTPRDIAAHFNNKNIRDKILALAKEKIEVVTAGSISLPRYSCPNLIKEKGSWSDSVISSKLGYSLQMVTCVKIIASHQNTLFLA